MKWSSTGALAMSCCMLFALTEESRGQIVRILPDGGVRVRAPFARVRVDSYGTSVRAPFVSIFVGPRRRIDPIEQVSRQLADSARYLQWSLGRFTSRESWRKFLRVPSDPDLAQLQTALERYDRVVQNPNYGKIARLPSFLATRANLAGCVDLLSSAAKDSESKERSFEELPPPESTE